MAKRLAGLALLLAAGWAHAQEIDLQVELLNRVGTDTCRKGDLVTAKIVSPTGFVGSTVEGKVTQCAQSRGGSALDIDFDILRQANAVTPINARITNIYNSKGQANVDEDGRSIRQSAPKPSSGTGGLGRTLGGLAGGRGAQIGGAVDRTATVMARMSTDAPSLRFDPGARFVLRATARSGPSLASWR
jgi:hypothetical protein